jgi:hypothetical protein
MAAFGLACAAGKRYDTNVPALLLSALAKIAGDGEAVDTKTLGEFYRDPVIAPAVRFVCDSYQKQAPTEKSRNNWLSKLAVYSWFTGDLPGTSAALKKLQAPLTQEAADVLIYMDADEADLRAAAAMADTGHTQSYEQALQFYRDRKFPEARSILTANGKDIDPASRTGVARLLKVIDVEAKFQKGETVRLDTPDGLLLWERPYGNWVAAPDGAITASGFDGQGRLFHRARFGNRFEMTAEVIFHETKADGQGFGIGVGKRTSGYAFSAWNACELYSGEKPRTGVGAALAYGFTKSGVPSKTAPFKDFSKPVRFTVRVADNKLTFRAGDWTAFDAVTGTRSNPEHTPFIWPEDGKVGFAFIKFISSHPITVRSVTVKKIP